MFKLIDFDTADLEVLDLFDNGQQYGEYDTLFYCMRKGWLELYQWEDGTYFIGGRVSSHSLQCTNQILERMSRATYGSDAVHFQLLLKNFVTLAPMEEEIWWVYKELPVKGGRFDSEGE